mmetsp:Transcript_2190/g.3510  ORF Transcript_2190/g.3510 Transcript_2190/m.3510 type:complete len:126 (+) Transcript_2190:751-1128(+)
MDMPWACIDNTAPGSIIHHHPEEVQFANSSARIFRSGPRPPFEPQGFNSKLHSHFITIPHQTSSFCWPILQPLSYDLGHLVLKPHFAFECASCQSGFGAGTAYSAAEAKTVSMTWTFWYILGAFL